MNPFNVNPLVRGPFTTAGTICSPERLTKWLLKKPDIAHHVLRMSADWAIGVAEYFRDTFGLEGVLPIMGDPSHPTI
jgi:uroporphyrinogen-III decarboxylase